jgi:kynureninase
MKIATFAAMQNTYEFTEEFASKADSVDPLKDLRNHFLFPQHEGENCLYFTGNSLGLQPKAAKAALQQELDDWAKYGVEGHFEAKNPWFNYHELFTSSLAKLVGAKENEVVCMNQLTTNLHLLMVSFYQPKGKRYKILCEGKAFPSDQYALESQVRFHGFSPSEAIIELHPRWGEHTLRTEDILQTIEQHASELALIMIGGVNYYTGQLLDMKGITEAGQKAGARVGWDLAHAAGNVPLELHNWNVDFAAWCSYKYLNSGPGGVSGVYIHEKHSTNTDLIRFAGWWGHDKDVRFKMEKGFKAIPNAEGWQLSNAPVFQMAVHRASLDMFDKVGMQALREKSLNLTAYLEFIIETISQNNTNVNFEIITPKNKSERGAQLSILCHGQGKSLFDKLTQKGVVADWREPNVIRIAPVPMYNNFEDVYRFGKILESAL